MSQSSAARTHTQNRAWHGAVLAVLGTQGAQQGRGGGEEGSLPNTALPAFHSPSLPTRTLRFTSDFGHPKAATFPQTLWQLSHISQRAPSARWAPELIFTPAELRHWLGTCRYPKPFISSNPVKVLQKRSPEWGLASAGP